MWTLILYLAFGVPGEHDRSADEAVARFATYEACDQARWEWYEADRLPEGYAPHYSIVAPKTKGWFQVTPPACDPAEPLVS